MSKGARVKATVRKSVCRHRDDAEDLKALAWSLLSATEGMPKAHDLAMLVDRIAGKLTSGLNDLAGKLRGTDEGAQLTLIAG